MNRLKSTLIIASTALLAFAGAAIGQGQGLSVLSRLLVVVLIAPLTVTITPAQALSRLALSR